MFEHAQTTTAFMKGKEMRKSTSGQTQKNQLAVSLEGLQELCGCGRKTAEEIASAAGASFKIGKRRLYSVEKVREYISAISGTE